MKNNISSGWIDGNKGLKFHKGCLRPLFFEGNVATCPDCGGIWGVVESKPEYFIPSIKE